MIYRIPRTLIGYDIPRDRRHDQHAKPGLERLRKQNENANSTFPNTSGILF